MIQKMDINKLTKAEENIMHMLWQKGEAMVSELIDEMPDPKPPHSSISSIIRILEKKKFVHHKAYGKTHVYFPLISKKQYTSFSLKKIIQSYFSGSPSALVSFLVEDEVLTEEDIVDIKRQLDLQ